MFEFIFAISLAIFVSAFCSISEAAFYSITPGTVEAYVNEKRRGAVQLKKIKTDLNSYIASILIINTTANIYGTYLATKSAIKIFPEALIPFFPFFMTLAILFLAEMFPKTIGVQFDKKLAPIFAIPFYYITLAIFPIVRLITMVTNLFPKKEDDHTFTDKEIQSIAAMSEQEGSINTQEASVIQNILSLRSKTAREIMTPRTVMFSFDKIRTFREISEETSAALRYSRIPIYDSNPEKIIGHFLRREFYHKLNDEETQNDTIETIVRPIQFIPETKPINEVLAKFLSEKEHMMIVVDEYGGLDGIITLEDVLEEILGTEIIDEFDTAADMQEYAKRTSKSLRKVKP